MSGYLVLNLDDVALNYMLNAPTGDVGIDLLKRGHRVLTGARRDVGVRTGRLRASLHTEMGVGPVGPKVSIGSNVNYALMHHEGTAPHLIRAKQGRVLAFNTNGVRIYRHQVHHPGTAANNYLSGNLYRALY